MGGAQAESRDVRIGFSVYWSQMGLGVLDGDPARNFTLKVVIVTLMKYDMYVPRMIWHSSTLIRPMPYGPKHPISEKQRILYNTQTTEICLFSWAPAISV